MKEIKKYAMALVALVIAMASVTLMSAGLKNSNPKLVWFEVNPSGIILNTVMTSPPSLNCLIHLQENYCAVELLDDHNFTNISDVPDTYQKAGREE